MAPYWLISGMTPAQGATTGAFMATGMSISSATAFRNTDHFPKDKTLLYTLAFVAFIASILGAIILPKMDIQTFKYLLAITTLAALPLLYVKPSTKHLLSVNRRSGFGLAIGSLIVGSIITSSAFSLLFTLTLMAFFNMSVLQMTALRRLVGIVQSIVLFTALALQGYFIWQHAIAGFIGGSIGSYIGTKYAVIKGESFAKNSLMIISLAATIALLI